MVRFNCISVIGPAMPSDGRPCVSWKVWIQPFSVASSKRARTGALSPRAAASCWASHCALGPERLSVMVPRYSGGTRHSVANSPRQ